MQKQLSINNLFAPNRLNKWQQTGIRMLDRLLGISKMNTLYCRHNMQGLSKEAFADKLLEILDVSISGEQTFLAKIPKTGPLVIASNHPFGGIEGVILARVISKIRPDLKVLANQGLKLFDELTPYFIFTNPLSEKDPRNGPSLRHCLQHVKAGNALLMFPAGRVSYYQADKKRISEHGWNRIVKRLCAVDDAQYLPVFINGQNSQWFYRLGRIYYRLRMLMLARELLSKKGTTVYLDCGFPVSGHKVSSPELARAMSYAQGRHWQTQWPEETNSEHQQLLSPIDQALIGEELKNLPAEQKLLQHKNYQIFYGWQTQLSHTVTEIARLREWVFRQHNEGSGLPLDTDDFDATYIHLFVFDIDNNEIVGAYRMGQTDQLIEHAGLAGVYLNKMFKFSPQFVNQQQPCLELGRSFLVPRLQRSHIGLYLLWRGIGAFVCKFPQYRTLYGTVSISKLYDPRSVTLIEHAYVERSEKVTPRLAFEKSVEPEIAEYAKLNPLKNDIPALLQSLEADGKGIPILQKQYLKLGARCHCLGIDPSFNQTPGLLLSVDLTQIPIKLLKLYLGKNFQNYLDYPQRSVK